MTTTLPSLKTLYKTKYAWDTILSDPSVDIVAFDTETTGLDHWVEGYQTRGFSIATRFRGNIVVESFPLTFPRSDNMPREAALIIFKLLAKKQVLVQNINFDRRNILQDYGVWFPKIMDTTKLSHLLDENWGMNWDGTTRVGRSLENLGQHYLGEGKVSDPVFEALKKSLGWGGLWFEHLEKYMDQDASLLLRLYERLIELLKQNGELQDALEYWDQFDAPNFDALFMMKSRGIAVDVAAAHAWDVKGEMVMQQIRDELGFDPNKSTELRKVLWEDLKLPILYNEKKNKATGEIKRSPTTDKKAMEQYEEMLAERPDMKDNPLASNILKYRGWSKACSSYYKPYQELLSPDGRLRPDYKMHGTVTGRYACEKPNLQQIPKESDKEWNGQIKQLFKPLPGHELWEYDYSQLEFRLNAHFSQEPFLLEVFNDHERDIFTEMSKQLGWTRQQCKGFTYSTLYGAGKGRIANVFGVSENEAAGLIDDFYGHYPNLRALSRHIQNIVRKSGKIRLWSGRYRHFPNRNDAFKAANSFIQGGGADIVKHVMNRINREVPELRMLLQVHDSLVFEIPTEKLEYYKGRIEEIMTNPTADLGKEWRVEFKVDGHKLGEG